MIRVKQESKNKYTINDKLVKIQGNKIVYLDNFSNLEKETFREYLSKYNKKRKFIDLLK